ncbi:hypothetical protein B6S59_30090 [Pseudomonas sp. A46]|nr:hypothetical protein B6S59_30090 [Pseudomonas sp. A46]
MTNSKHTQQAATSSYTAGLYDIFRGRIPVQQLAVCLLGDSSYALRPFIDEGDDIDEREWANRSW